MRLIRSVSLELSTSLSKEIASEKFKSCSYRNWHTIGTQSETGSASAARKYLILRRRRSESNRRIKVLQTSALPLGYAAGKVGMKDEGGRMKGSVFILHPSAFILSEAGDGI
jgi:hypothetical protein